METKDLGIVDDNTGTFVGGQELDEDFNRQILPPKNKRPSGRPQKRMIESQTKRVSGRRCLQCHEVGHYKNTYNNPRADFDGDYAGDVVSGDDLLVGNLLS